MNEELEKDGKQQKGVIVEFDFAVARGAQALYKVTEQLMKEYEIPFNKAVECMHFVGGNYQGALAEYFNVIKTKKTASKAAKDLAVLWKKELDTLVAESVTENFKKFVRALTSKGVKVVVATRADVETVRPAFAELEGDNFELYQGISMTYGSVKWDAWRRAATTASLVSYFTIAVAGSGFGVKSALIAGMGAVAVTNEWVEWQDFGGADEVFTVLDKKAADTILKLLKVK